MSNISMKFQRWMPVFVIPIMMLGSCHENGQKAGSQQDSIVAVHTDSPVVSKAVVPDTLPTEAYIAELVRRREAISRQLAGMDTATAVKMYQSLSMYVDTAIAGLMHNESPWLDKYVEYYIPEKGITVPPPQVVARIKLLATAGIEPWEIGEGYTDLRAVPDFYTHLFKSSLPPDYTAFLQLKADEDTVLYSADAGLAVPFSLIGIRALNWEKFLDTYPNSALAPAAKELYEWYCIDYLFGEDNTPAFDRQEDLKSLVPENRQEYTSFVAQHGDTKTGAVVAGYLQKLSTAKSYEPFRAQIKATIEAVHAPKK